MNRTNEFNLDVFCKIVGSQKMEEIKSNYNNTGCQHQCENYGFLKEIYEVLRKNNKDIGTDSIEKIGDDFVTNKEDFQIFSEEELDTMPIVFDVTEVEIEEMSFNENCELIDGETENTAVKNSDKKIIILGNEVIGNVEKENTWLKSESKSYKTIEEISKIPVNIPDQENLSCNNLWKINNEERKMSILTDSVIKDSLIQIHETNSNINSVLQRDCDKENNASYNEDTTDIEVLEQKSVVPKAIPRIDDYLPRVKTPERKGKVQSQRSSFVITSTQYKKELEEKEKEKEEKKRKAEENKRKREENRRKSEEDKQKRILKQQTKQNTKDKKSHVGKKLRRS